LPHILRLSIPNSSSPYSQVSDQSANSFYDHDNDRSQLASRQTHAKASPTINHLSTKLVLLFYSREKITHFSERTGCLVKFTASVMRALVTFEEHLNKPSRNWKLQYLCTFSKTDVISLVWKHYCTFRLGLVLRLADIMSVGEQNRGGMLGRICPNVKKISKCTVCSPKKNLHFQICPNIFKFARITSKRGWESCLPAPFSYTYGGNTFSVKRVFKQDDFNGRFRKLQHDARKL